MKRSKSFDQNLIKRILKHIDKNENFIITTHVNPDGDSIASLLVFSYLLKYKNKRYRLLLDDKIPKKFDFLAGVKEIEGMDISSKAIDPEVVVVLDSSDLGRIGRVKELIADDSKIINIDHHPSNDLFGDINLIMDEESSTVEIVYRLYSYLNIPVSEEVATLVYTGVMCDTGRFHFSNTNYRSLSVCAEMVKFGASPTLIANKIYYRMSTKTAQALASALSKIEFYFENRVACMYLLRCDYESSDEIDTEGFVDYLMAVEDTAVQFFMLETEENTFRVSLRSKNSINVNEIARHFGGGGHFRASGCTIHGTLDEIKSKILGTIEMYL